MTYKRFLIIVLEWACKSAGCGYSCTLFKNSAELGVISFSNSGTIFSNKEGRDSFSLQFDILDNHTFESSSFDINMPDQIRYDWIYESDVYVENGKINILATSNLNNEDELHLYTVDENIKELEQDSFIA
ncbi:hypothetical protein ABNX05_26225, partial [Lysinibacillus sp. M3]